MNVADQIVVAVVPELNHKDLSPEAQQCVVRYYLGVFANKMADDLALYTAREGALVGFELNRKQVPPPGIRNATFEIEIELEGEVGKEKKWEGKIKLEGEQIREAVEKLRKLLE